MEKIFFGILLLGLGTLFFFNNKNVAKGAAKFYQTLYKEDNLNFMFKAIGVIVFLAGLALLFS